MRNRFINADTVLTANRFGYCAGNPIMLSDSSGTIPQDAMCEYDESEEISCGASLADCAGYSPVYERYVLDKAGIYSLSNAVSAMLGPYTDPSEFDATMKEFMGFYADILNIPIPVDGVVSKLGDVKQALVDPYFSADYAKDRLDTFYRMLNDIDRSDLRVAYVELEIISLLRSEYRFSGYDVHGNKLAATKIMSNHEPAFTAYLIIELEKTMNLSQYRKEHRHVSLSEEFK